jgi:hypothetical protein
MMGNKADATHQAVSRYIQLARTSEADAFRWPMLAKADVTYQVGHKERGPTRVVGPHI